MAKYVEVKSLARQSNGNGTSAASTASEGGVADDTLGGAAAVGSEEASGRRGCRTLGVAAVGAARSPPNAPDAKPMPWQGALARLIVHAHTGW
mmetsp:Transcript_51058/g.146585  ORF Transcript_51058/g.146585 Transcript_51058/m.146585 type:complete len:93 (-) Transcript_51058:47-325(-)